MISEKLSDDRTDWSLVVLLWLAGLGSAAQYGKVSVIFDELALLYPESGAGFGWIVSLVGGVGMICGVVAGIIVGGIGFRRTLIITLWLGAVMSAVQSGLPSIEWMLLSRLVEGLSHLGIVVAIPTLIAQVTAPRHRGFALTLWGTFFGVAFALLAWIGRPFALTHGLSALFLAHAAYLAAFAIILHVRLRGLSLSRPAFSLSIGQILRDHIAIYKSPRIAAPGAGWLFYTFCFVSTLTLLPPYLTDENRAFVIGSMPLISILSSMTIGIFLLRYISAVAVVLIGFALSFASVVGLGLLPAHPVPCFCLAAALGLIQGASFAAVPQLNDTAVNQARANGAMAQMGNIGNGIGTPFVLFGMSLWGYSALPIMVGTAFLLGFASHLFLGYLRRR